MVWICSSGKALENCFNTLAISSTFLGVVCAKMFKHLNDKTLDGVSSTIAA